MKHCRVNVIFIDKQGNKHNIQGKVGDNVLHLAHKHGIELEGLFTNFYLAFAPKGYFCSNIYLLSHWRWTTFVNYDINKVIINF